jgi:hypothetical protein
MFTESSRYHADIYYILCTILVYNYIHTSSHWLEDHPAKWLVGKHGQSLPSWKTSSIFEGPITKLKALKQATCGYFWYYLFLLMPTIPKLSI